MAKIDLRQPAFHFLKAVFVFPGRCGRRPRCNSYLSFLPFDPLGFGALTSDRWPLPSDFFVLRFLLLKIKSASIRVYLRFQVPGFECNHTFVDFAPCNVFCPVRPIITIFWTGYFELFARSIHHKHFIHAPEISLNESNIICWKFLLKQCKKSVEPAVTPPLINLIDNFTPKPASLHWLVVCEWVLSPMKNIKTARTTLEAVIWFARQACWK